MITLRTQLYLFSPVAYHLEERETKHRERMMPVKKRVAGELGWRQASGELGGDNKLVEEERERQVYVHQRNTTVEIGMRQRRSESEKKAAYGDGSSKR